MKPEREASRELERGRGAGPLLLDGAALARARTPGLARRAAAVRARRGTPPNLALIAFAGARGGAPYAARKVRAAEAVGVAVAPLVLPVGVTTEVALRESAALLEADEFDGVFLEFPFPDGIDGDALTALIPERADIDVMTPARIERYLAGADPLPPLTVAAGLELLDAYDVEISGARGVVVAEPSPFALSFREAFVRRGAALPPVVAPDAPELEREVGAAGLVVIAAGQPGLIPARLLAPGAVAIDVGYFNPGGRGDIDTATGIEHLAVIAPVPGGIGPMTISVLLERLIEFAERP